MNLLPCPFCGSDKIDRPLENLVGCGYCEIYLTKNKWNIRHSPWISVKDRLPEKEGRYLVLRSQKTWKYEENIKIEWFHAIDIYSKNKDLHRMRFIQCGIKEDLKITHWMPLPSLPEEK